MQKHNKRYMSLLLAAVVMVVVNFLIFLGVYTNNPHSFQSVIDSLYASIGLYLFFLILCVVSLVLGRKKVIRVSFYTLLTFMTIHVLYNLYILIIDQGTNQNGGIILLDAFLIWSSSILIFSVWYWMLDKQSSIGEVIEQERTHYDFLFPQNQTNIKLFENWRPRFFDYISLSFFTSTSFAPADTLPVTKRARFLMMLEALVSLIIIGMITARAISLIK
jgi:hypothetical protein